MMFNALGDGEQRGVTLKKSFDSFPKKRHSGVEANTSCNLFTNIVTATVLKARNDNNWFGPFLLNVK